MCQLLKCYCSCTVAHSIPCSYPQNVSMKPWRLPDPVPVKQPAAISWSSYFTTHA